MKRITALTLVSAVALGGVVLTAPAASAKDGDLKQRGSCTSPSTSSWAVKVKPRKGQLRADFWVKNNTTGQPWTLVITQNGAPVGSPVTRTAGTRWRRSRPRSVSPDRRCAGRAQPCCMACPYGASPVTST